MIFRSGREMVGLNVVISTFMQPDLRGVGIKAIDDLTQKR